MSSEGGDVHTFHVAPRKRTRETIAVLVALAVLFLLLFVMIGRSSLPHSPIHLQRNATHGTPVAH